MKRIVIAGALAILASSPTWAGPDVDGLMRVANTTFDEVYVRQGWSPSGDLSVAHVGLAIGGQRELSEVGSRDLERLRQKLERELQSDSNAEGNVVLTVALTELTPNRVLSERSSRYHGTHQSVGIGGAAMEAIFRDAVTGDVLMVIVDERRGLPLTGNFHVQSGQIWGDADDIVEDWANELPAAL